MNDLYRAIQFAKTSHGEQKRIGGKPVMSHLLGTAANLVAYCNPSEEELIAAVLHDTVEDCNLTYTELELDFGTNVASLIHEVSEQEKNTFPIKTERGARIKMADRLNNLHDLDNCKPSFKAKQVLKTFQLLLDHNELFKKASVPLYNALITETKKRYGEVTNLK